jgi:hypothetical protein
MINLTPDTSIKIEWNPTGNKYAFAVNAVGAHAGVVLTEPDYTDTDDNTIYVSASTGADGNAGTQAAPKATLLGAINACTEVKTRVVILDSSTYIGELNFSNAHFQRMFKETGQTPIVSLRDLGYTPADANSIFVAKTGDDANAGTQAAPKLTVTGVAGALSVMDATHQNCVFLDSGTYDEEGFEITGNKLNFYAYYGCAPVLNMSKKYAQTEYTAVKAETIYTSDTDVYIGRPININDNAIMFLWTYLPGGGGKYLVLNSSNYSIIKSETIFNADLTENIEGLQLQTNNILISYKDSTHGGQRYIMLSDVDYSVVTTETVIPGTSYVHDAWCQQSSGNIIAFGSNGTTGYYKVLSSAMTLITDFTAFGDVGANAHISCSLFDNNDIVVAYRDGADGKGKYLILSGIDFSIIKSETIFADFDIRIFCSVSVLDDGHMLFCYCKVADGKPYRKLISGSDYSELLAEYKVSDVVTYGSGGCFSVNINSDIFLTYYILPFFGYAGYLVFHNLYQTFLVSASSIWNGITLTTDTPDYLNKVFDLSQNLFLSWCTIHGFEAPQIDLVTYTAHGSFKVDTNNCDIHDNDSGFYLTCNTVTIEDSLFYRLGKDYAIYINGAAAALGNITLEHLSIYNNYRGRRLENNNGANEVVKNCIFSANNNFGLQAETTMTLTYAIILDATSGIANGTGVVLANPLYINDGLVDEDDTDLHIKLKILGYITNSPAYNGADDSRDLGAYWCEYVGEQTTWSSMTLTKPEVIPTKREYSGAVNVQLADGSYDSYKESQSELVELKWKGVSNADYDEIDELWCSDNNSIRVYFNPTTETTTYYNFTLLRQPMNAGVEHWLIDSVAKQDVSLFLARTYEHV